MVHKFLSLMKGLVQKYKNYNFYDVLSIEYILNEKIVDLFNFVIQNIFK